MSPNKKNTYNLFVLPCQRNLPFLFSSNFISEIRTTEQIYLLVPFNQFLLIKIHLKK